MAKSTPIQTNFSGGEFGPHVEGRVDTERILTGLELCQNYIPTLEGPLTRRPGTKRVASVKDPSKPPRFIPFRFSNTEQYILEFGDRYIRFFTDQGQVVTSGTSYIVSGSTRISKQPPDPFFVLPSTFGFRATRTRREVNLKEFDANSSNPIVFSQVASGSILELPSFWDINMVQGISVAQKGDTLWIMHSSIPTFTLQRFSPQDWDLKYFNTIDGPYTNLNSHDSAGDAANVGFTVGFPLQVLNPNYDNSYAILFSHSSVRIADVTGTVGGEATVKVHGNHNFVSGQKVWIGGVQGTSEINNGSSTSITAFGKVIPQASESSVWVVSVVDASSFILRNSVFANAYNGSGIVYPAIFSTLDFGRKMGLYSAGHRYFGNIWSSSNVSGVDTFILNHLHPIYAKFTFSEGSENLQAQSTVISTWQLGTYGRQFGFPSAGTFHQDRLVFNGTPRNPTEFNASKISDYNFFNVSEASSLVVTDKNALQFNLNSDGADLLEWVQSGLQGLYFGSQAAEFIVSPSRDGQALTPTNINCDIIGNYGTSDVNPVRVGDAIVYVQSSKQKMRELRYFANIQAHKSTNISTLGDHVPFPEITALAVQKEFYPLIWALKSDGKFASMSYSREESEVRAGWASHELGGKSDSAGTHPKIKSMEVIKNSSGTYDQIWVAVQRFINGTSDVTVEYMEAPYRHRDINQKQRDAYYLDCGATYDSSLVIANITTGSALVTVANHGLNRNDLVHIDGVIGLNSSYVNADGVIFNSNLVNDRVFVVGSTTTNTFFLQDFNSSIILSATYSPYFSGGKARKLVSQITGLTWLKNEEVGVLADGGWHPDTVVNSAGVLALQFPAAVVQIGYRYKSRGKTLVKDSGSRTGSALGQHLKTYQAAFRLRDSGDFKFGRSFDVPLHKANFGVGDDVMANRAIPLYSGIYRDNIEMDIGFYGQVCFEQDSPLPGMIQSITYLMDEVDS